MFGKSVYQIGAAVNRAERERARRKIRPLSKSTMRRYNVDQLVNHLKICLSKLDDPPYLVNSYGEILEPDNAGDSWKFVCSSSDDNKITIRNLIRKVYWRERVSQ